MFISPSKVTNFSLFFPLGLNAFNFFDTDFGSFEAIATGFNEVVLLEVLLPPVRDELEAEVLPDDELCAAGRLIPYLVPKKLLLFLISLNPISSKPISCNILSIALLFFLG